jgi:hypothetical protein
MMEVARSGQLSEEEQHQAFRNAMTARMEQQMTDYFNLPEGKEREKYLDQLIDEQEKRMADHNRDQANRPPGPPPGQANQGNRGGGGGWRDPQRMKDRIENTAPDQRAKRAAFMKDMAARRQARGLPSRGGPGGPGGGGGRGGR